MRKFINWASIIFVCAFIYTVLSTYISAIPSLPIGDWDLLPSLAVIAAGISGYKLVRSKKYIELIDSGKINHFPAVMAALEIADKDIYKIIMQDYRSLVSKRIDALTAYIEDERYRAVNELHDKGTLDFDVREEMIQLNHYKALRETLSEVQRGKTTWENVNQKYMNVCEINHTEKYLLGELTEEENSKIRRDVEIIKSLRDGRNKVNV
ncbi:MAG: hypothetical protein J6J23_01455 [Clostridia bacterium]|nr:hypothetical protein [Clostridia bacterium]